MSPEEMLPMIDDWVVPSKIGNQQFSSVMLPVFSIQATGPLVVAVLLVTAEQAREMVPPSLTKAAPPRPA